MHGQGRLQAPVLLPGFWQLTHGSSASPPAPPPAIVQPVSSGDVFYVDPQRGSDSNAGRAVTAAFKSVQRCVDRLRGLPPSTAAPPGSECRCNGSLTLTQNFSRTITISISSPRYSAPASMHLSDWIRVSARADCEAARTNQETPPRPSSSNTYKVRRPRHTCSARIPEKRFSSMAQWTYTRTAGEAALLPTLGNEQVQVNPAPYPAQGHVSLYQSWCPDASPNPQAMGLLGYADCDSR